MTPVARSLGLLRKCGYLAEVVERWLPRVNRKRDLFHLADVLAVHPARREFLLVQVTTAGHLSHRLAKVRAVPELPGLLAAGCKVQLHGWKRRGSTWRVKVMEVRAKDLEAVVVCPIPRRASTRFRQGSLFAAAEK
jgi:carbonic anhydrase